MNRDLLRPPSGMKRAARHALTTEFGTEKVHTIMAQADRAYPSLATQIPTSRAGARHLLRTGAYVIALQRALVEHGTKGGDANALVSDIVFASIIPARTAVHRISALRHRDPLRRSAWGSLIASRLNYSEPDWRTVRHAGHGG